MSSELCIRMENNCSKMTNRLNTISLQCNQFDGLAWYCIFKYKTFTFLSQKFCVYHSIFNQLQVDYTSEMVCWRAKNVRVNQMLYRRLLIKWFISDCSFISRSIEITSISTSRLQIICCTTLQLLRVHCKLHSKCKWFSLKI